MAKSSFTRIDFGPLPHELVNDTLGYELEPGEVGMSANAQRHALERHQDEFWDCRPHIADIIARPLYLGDDFRNSGKIEFVGRPASLGTPLLIAVVITPDAHGRYNIASFYPVSEAKVQSRTEKGFLKIARRKKP